MFTVTGIRVRRLLALQWGAWGVFYRLLSFLLFPRFQMDLFQYRADCYGKEALKPKLQPVNIH